MNLVIIGGTGGTNVADSILRASKQQNLNAVLYHNYSAYQAPKLVKTLNWYLRGRYPSNLQR